MKIGWARVLTHLVSGEPRRYPSEGSTVGSTPVRGGARVTAVRGAMFVEAAFILLIFVAVMFATVDAGTIYFQRHSIQGVGYAVAGAVQQNPDMTVDELYAFVKTLAGPSTPFREIVTSSGASSTDPNCSPSVCSIDGLTVRVLTSQTKLTKADLLNVKPIAAASSFSGVPSSWSNPWLVDNSRTDTPPRSSDPAVAAPSWYDNDQSPYYVGVLVEWKVRGVTKVLTSVKNTWQFVSTYSHPSPAMTWQVMRDSWQGCESWPLCPLAKSVQGAPCHTLHLRCSSQFDNAPWMCGEPNLCPNPPPNQGTCKRVFKCTWN